MAWVVISEDKQLSGSGQQSALVVRSPLAALVLVDNRI